MTYVFNKIISRAIEKKIGWILACVLLTTGCTKLVQVDPPINNLSSENVFSTDAIAASVVTGIYTNMSLGNSRNGKVFNSGFTSMSLFPSLSADELTLFNLNSQEYSVWYRNSLPTSPTFSTMDFWTKIYPLIYTANSVIEDLGSSTGLTPSVRQQLLGESKFMRAFCYFYLVNLYGDVPLAITTDFKINAVLPRTSKVKVYQQIVEDLIDAQNLLSVNYLDGTVQNITSERVRPTKCAAAALLARTYLYTGEWAKAEAEADTVIANSTLYSLLPLNNVFVKNSNEAIWQLQAVGTGLYANTGEGQFFILPSTGPSIAYPVYMNDSLVKNFEPGDLRRTNWIDSVTSSAGITYYYPYKYKIGLVNTATKEYSMILRLAEQYLIRAEARAKQGTNLSGAIADLNAIRNRAGLPNTTANNQTDLLTAILQERKHELFTEWGHRWLDLKRTGTVDAVMGTGGACAAKGGTWNTNWQLYPIRLNELLNNPFLVQNPGYN